MRLVVFGASGKVGRLVVAEALRRGYWVRAFTHSHPRVLGADPHLEIVRGDVHNRESVARAVQGMDAIASTLGSWGSSSKDIVSAGTAAIIPAMHQASIERIVSVTGADAWDPADRPTVRRRLSHIGAKIAAKRIVNDGENHIRLLRASGLNWTVLRSPVMTRGGGVLYKLSLQAPAPWSTIPRRAVARAVVDQLDGPGYSQSAPFISRH